MSIDHIPVEGDGLLTNDPDAAGREQDDVRPGFRIDSLWAFTSIDEDDEEGILAFKTGDTWMPLIGSDLDRMKDLRAVAQKLCNQSGKDLKLRRFDWVTDIEVVRPEEGEGTHAVTVVEEPEVKVEYPPEEIMHAPQTCRWCFASIFWNQFEDKWSLNDGPPADGGSLYACSGPKGLHDYMREA